MSVRPPEVWAAHEYAVIGTIFFFLFSVAPILAVSLMFMIDPMLIINWIFFMTGFLIPLAWVFPLTIAAGLLAIVILLIFIGAYLATIKRIDDGLYEAAKTPCLIMGIIGLVIGLLIPGLFYMLAYTKLGEVILRYGPVASRTVLSPAGIAQY